MGNNSDRYCDYVHKLHQISGLPSDFIVRDVLPLRDIPHKADPRRERSLKQVLEIRFTNESRLPANEPAKMIDDIPWLLRRIVVPPRRSAPLTDTAHMPNCRDPRRFRACQRRGAPGTLIGLPNLVDNPEIPAEEETCPVLTIDLTDWPKSTHSYVELVPHECNILRASEFACADNSSEQLVDCDNENVNVLLETMRRHDSDDVEIVDDDVTEVSGYDAGDGSKPMLAIDDSLNCVYDVEQPAKNFLGDDELPPIPVVKPEPLAERPVPSFDEKDIDLIDLCDDEEDDVKFVLPKRERSSSVECVGQKAPGVLEVITLDSDDDDEDSGRNTAMLSTKSIATAEQHMGSTSEVTESLRIMSSLGGERESDCQMNEQPTVTENVNVINCDVDAIANQSQALDEVTPMHVDEEDYQVQDSVINNFEAEFNELWESMEDERRPEISISLHAEKDEVQTTKTDADVAVTSKPEQPMDLEIETRENSNNDSHVENDKTDNRALSRRISIVTSDAFDAQKKLLIDVISNSNNDTSLEDGEIPNSSDEATSEQTIPVDSATEQLQRVINDMTCANYLGRSIFANSSTKKETFAGSDKRKRRETPEKNASDETLAEQPKEKRPKRKRRRKERQPITSGAQAINKITSSVSNASNAIAIFQKKALYNVSPVMNWNFFNFNRVLLNNLINYVRNYNITRSTIEFMLYGELSVVTALQVFNETFWRNRFNHWNHNAWDSSINTESSNLSIRENTIALLPQDNEVKNQAVDASYFLKYPTLKSIKLPIESAVKRTSQDSQFYSVKHTLKINSEIKDNTTKEFKPNEINANTTSLEIKKIKKRHSLPTAIVHQPYSCLKRSRSKSHDSWDDHTNNSISSIKLKLTRDQSNQQNWIASNSQESSNTYSRNNSLEKAVHKLNCKEKIDIQQKTFVSNQHCTEVKNNCHLTIDLSKFQSCINKTVPELDNNDYSSKPVMNNNFIDKYSLEKNLSPFLKSRVKRHLHEAVDIELQSNFISKRQKLSESILDTRTNINISNDVNNHLNDKIKQERRSLELSKSLNDYSKKDLPKNFKNNVSNLNISLVYGDDYKNNDKVHIRSESNKTVQIDHNSNIAKDTHKKQRIYTSERNYTDICRKKKRKSEEMDERKKKKIGHKFAEIFGDSDSDALEIISNPSTLDTDDDHDSDANYENNATNLDGNNINTTLEKLSAVSKIESVLNTAENCIELPTVNLEIEQTKHLSSLIQENQESDKELVNKTEVTSDINKSTEHLNKDIHSKKSYENSMLPAQIEKNKTEVASDVNRSREHLSKDIQSEKSFENSMSLEQIEKNSTENILSKTSQNDIEIYESYTNSVTISIKAKEFLDKCVSERQLDVPPECISTNTISETNLSETMLEKTSSTLITEENLSEIATEDEKLADLNGTNRDISNDNSAQTIDLQEGDFDFEVDNHSDYSYDGCVNLDDVESKDSYCVTIQSLEDNENADSETLKSKEQCLLVSKRFEVKTKQNNDHCLDKSHGCFNECVTEETCKIVENNGNNNEGTATKDSKTDNTDENKIHEKNVSSMNSNNESSISEFQVENEISTILSPNQNSPITLGNGETVSGNINNKNCLISNDDTIEPSSTSISVPNRNFYDDLKDPKVLNKFNIFIEDMVPEDTNNENLRSIQNLEEQNVNEFFNKINSFSEISTSENILEGQSNRLTNNHLGNTFDEFKKFNIHFVDIDTETNNANNSTVKSFAGSFKVRNINELLEKPKTLSPTNVNSRNKKIVDQVEITPSTNKNSLDLRNSLESVEEVKLDAISNSIFSSLDQLVYMNSVTLSSQAINPVGINNLPTIVPQTNNQSCNNLLPANSLLQSMSISNDSQVCIKLASNMFSNEFSTAKELPTIYSMKSPPTNTLKLLLPEFVLTVEKLMQYKKLLVEKLYSYLESLEKVPRKDFARLSNNLLKYETLSTSTWIFQHIILTIMQCIGRLIFCATGENKRRIIEIIERTKKLSDYKQFCLKEAVILYKKLADQGLCQKHIFLYDPLLMETKYGHNSKSDLDSKMSKDQMATYLQQIAFYRSCQNLPPLKINSSTSVVSNSMTTCQINSFQICSSNGAQTKVSTVQNDNVQISQVQHIQTKPTPKSTPQSNSIQTSQPINCLLNQTCSICKKESGLMILCNVCKNATYCSLNCQESDYEKHSKTCKKI